MYCTLDIHVFTAVAGELQYYCTAYTKVVKYISNKFTTAVRRIEPYKICAIEPPPAVYSDIYVGLLAEYFKLPQSMQIYIT